MAGSTNEPVRLIAYLPEGARLSPEESLDRFLSWVEARGLAPYPAQEEALLELATQKHVVLSTPTGSGKSLVALGLHFRAMGEGRRSFYTAPIKALVSEKFFALCEELGPENVGMLTGDASINWAAPVICCTAEVLANMALRQGERADAPYVVMDEFHYYADRDRGWAWQVPLLVLRDTTFLLMSATLGNTASIEERLEQLSGRTVSHVHSDDRPVPLDFEYRETPLLETVEGLLDQGRFPVYIVHFTQREAAEQAQGLTSAKLTSREDKQEISRAIGGFRFDTPYGKEIQRFLRFGVGVHHAGLLPKYRLLVEQLSQRGLLKAICGTDTLGVGVNIPIRSVLFSKLSKFDGEKVGLLSVRNFRQIAGRAGRKGFDDHGSVLCQAPEHVIENKRKEARDQDSGRKRKTAKRKPPPRGFVSWTRDTFEQLTTRPAETLRSQFVINHGIMMNLLQRGEEDGLPGSGYDALAELIERCHETPARKRRLRRDAAVLFRSLRTAGVVSVGRDPDSGSVIARVDSELQRDFSLHHALSLYLVDAVTALDREGADYALDVVSVVEAVLENPRALLEAQVRKRKGELIARLKAERVPYEERMEKLETVTWDRPCADFLYSTFNLFAAHHPWVGTDNVRPKSIAREILERYSDFDDYVLHYGLQRMEGVLLRYVSQVHNTLVRNVPESARSDEVWDAIGFLRALVVRVDSSLIEEWESLVAPGRAPAAKDVALPARPPRRPTRKEIDALIRGELHQLVAALARGDYEGAISCVYPDVEDPWDAQRFEDALTPFLAEYERVVSDPEARRNHRTLIRERGPEWLDAHQVLVDPQGDNLWNIEAEVRLGADNEPGVPLIRVRRIGT